MIVALVIFWVVLPFRQAETIGFRNFSFLSLEQAYLSSIRFRENPLRPFLIRLNCTQVDLRLAA